MLLTVDENGKWNSHNEMTEDDPHDPETNDTLSAEQQGMKHYSWKNKTCICYDLWCNRKDMSFDERGWDIKSEEGRSSFSEENESEDLFFQRNLGQCIRGVYCSHGHLSFNILVLLTLFFSLSE